MDLATGKTIDGRYTVQGLLGRGGMASVYLAHDARLRIEVALKVLHVPAAAIRDRLLQEGRIQAALQHPNVLGVTDIVDVDGCPGLVMALVRGPSLDTLLTHCSLGDADAERLARGIVAGVRAAHGAGVIHRDLKPGNVLLARVDDGVVPMVADFGLVKLLGPDGGSGTRSGLPMGTPQYMAPEQIRGIRDIDQRADLFSLGAVLYELFCGRKAFGGDDVYEIFAAIQGGDWIRPGPVDRVPGHIAQAIGACLEPDRAQRVASCEALLAMIDAGGGAPQGPWGMQVLASVASLHPEAVSVSAQPSSATWHETGLAPLSDQPGPAPPSEPARGRAPRVWLLGALVAIAALGLFAGLGTRAPTAVYRPGQPPPVQSLAPVEVLAGQAWQELLDNEDHDALAHVDQALSQAPDDPALHLLRAALSLGLNDWDRFTRHVLDGAAAVEHPDTAVGALLLAMAPGVRVEGDLAWLGPVLWTHLERFPDDYLARHLWVVGMSADGGVPFDDQVVQAQLARHPETATAHVGALYARMLHQGPQAALDTGLAGLERHPRNAALEGGVAMALMKLGRPGDAVAHATRCLQRDPAWFECRVTAAQSALMIGDEAAYQRTRDVMSGEDVPPQARLDFLAMTVRTLDDRGRPLAADRSLARYRELSTADVPTQVLLRKQSEILGGALFPLAATAQGLDARLRALDRELTVPGLTARHRQRPGVWSQLAHGVMAARAGDLDEARRVLERLADEPSAWRLSLELMAAEGDVASLVQTGKRCAPPTYAGLLLYGLGQAEAARALLTRAVSEEGCRARDAQQRGLAHGALSLLAHGRGDSAAAAEHLAAFRRQWPRPEPGVPLVQALARVHGDAALGGAP